MHFEPDARFKRAHRCNQSVIINAFSFADRFVVEGRILLKALSKPFLWLVALFSVDHSEGTACDNDEHIRELFVRDVLGGSLFDIELTQVYRAHIILHGFLIVCKKVILFTVVFLEGAKVLIE